MTDPSPSCPMPRSAVIDTYFLENRAKLIDIAAFLDRVGRSAGDGDEDFRLAVFRRAMTLLLDGQDQRARRVLEEFSDFTEELPQSAKGMKGALGAPEEARS